MKSQRQIIRRHHKESQGSRSFFKPKFPADENRASFHTAGGVTPTVHAHRPPLGNHWKYPLQYFTPLPAFEASSPRWLDDGVRIQL